MAKLYNGTGGEFRYQGQKVGKVNNWRLDIKRDAIDVTSLGEPDSNYVLTLRQASGAATVWYDAADSATVSLFQSLLSNQSNATVQLKLVIDKADAKYFEFAAVVTSLSTGSSINEVTKADFQFQVCGEITGSL